MLTSNQVDSLTQLIRVSISFAANSLSEIVDTKVSLKVPAVKVFSSNDRHQVNNLFGEDNSYAMVKQDFQGNLTGTTALAFSSENAIKLVSLLTDTPVAKEEIDIMQTGTLLEIGNIINNAFLGTLNSQFNFHVNYKLPEFNEVNIAHLLDVTFGEEQDGLVIVANTTISVKVKDIVGHLVLLFKVSDMEYLKRKLDMMAG